jgi:hypothetical protein
MLPARELGTDLPPCAGRFIFGAAPIGSRLPEIDAGEADWHFTDPAVLMGELLDGGHRVDATAEAIGDLAS